MKQFARQLILLLLLLMVALGWRSAGATPPLPPVLLRLDTVSTNWSTGEVKIRLTAKPYEGQLSATLKLQPFDKIGANVMVPATLDFSRDKLYTQEFTLTVPPHDTLGLEICEESGVCQSWAALFFVTTDSEPKMFRGNPRFDIPIPKMPPIPQPRKDMVSGVLPSADRTSGNLVLTSVTLPKHHGPGLMLLALSPKSLACQEATVNIRADSPLMYTGEQSLTIRPDMTDPYLLQMPITIPPLDTSSIVITLECGSTRRTVEQVFVTTGDTLECYRKSSTGLQPAVRSVGEAHLLNPSQGESGTTGSAALTNSGGTVTREQMEQLEEQALTEYARQEIVVDSVHYERDSGDYRFRRVEGIVDWKAWDKKVRDSLANMPLSAEFRVNLFVPDSTRLAFVRSHVAKLIPAGNPDTTHYYDAEATLATIREFDKMGIRVGYHGLKPIDRSDGPRKKQTNPKQLNYLLPVTPDGGAATTSTTTVFYDGFEGTWPGVWSSWDFMDSYDLSGVDTWAPVDCKSQHGNRSLWCNGQGDRIRCGYYDTYCNSVLETVTPIDLRAFQNAKITYSVWYDMPVGWFDGFASYVKYDDTVWHYLEDFKGSNMSWSERTFSIHSGGPVYFKFVFDGGAFLPTSSASFWTISL